MLEPPGSNDPALNRLMVDELGQSFFHFGYFTNSPGIPAALKSDTRPQ